MDENSGEPSDSYASLEYILYLHSIPTERQVVYIDASGIASTDQLSLRIADGWPPLFPVGHVIAIRFPGEAYEKRWQGLTAELFLTGWAPQLHWHAPNHWLIKIGRLGVLSREPSVLLRVRLWSASRRGYLVGYYNPRARSDVWEVWLRSEEDAPGAMPTAEDYAYWRQMQLGPRRRGAAPYSPAEKYQLANELIEACWRAVMTMGIDLSEPGPHEGITQEKIAAQLGLKDGARDLRRYIKGAGLTWGDLLLDVEVYAAEQRVRWHEMERWRKSRRPDSSDDHDHLD